MKAILNLYLGGTLLFLAACSKSNNQHVSISGQQFSAGSYLQPGDTLNSKNASNGRAIKGTLATGQTYYLSSLYADATINSGDTLVVQSGVKVLVVGPTSGTGAIGTQDHAPGIIVNGTFLLFWVPRRSPIFYRGRCLVEIRSARRIRRTRVLILPSRAIGVVSRAASAAEISSSNGPVSNIRVGWRR